MAQASHVARRAGRYRECASPKRSKPRTHVGPKPGLSTHRKTKNACSYSSEPVRRRMRGSCKQNNGTKENKAGRNQKVSNFGRGPPSDSGRETKRGKVNDGEF